MRFLSATDPAVDKSMTPLATVGTGLGACLHGTRPCSKPRALQAPCEDIKRQQARTRLRGNEGLEEEGLEPRSMMVSGRCQSCNTDRVARALLNNKIRRGTGPSKLPSPRFQGTLPKDLEKCRNPAGTRASKCHTNRSSARQIRRNSSLATGQLGRPAHKFFADCRDVEESCVLYLVNTH